MIITRCKKFTLTLTLIYGCTLSNARADEHSRYQDQIDKIGKEISTLSDRLNGNKKKLKSERDNLFETEKSMGVLSKQIRENESAELEQAALVKELDSSIHLLEQRTQLDRDALAAMLRKRYMQGPDNYLKMILNQENPYAVGRLQHYYYFFSAAQQTRINQLDQQARELSELRLHRLAKQKSLAQQKEKNQARRATLSNKKQQRSKSVTSLTKQVESNSKKLEKLRLDRSRLKSLLQQLAVQAEELRRLEQARVVEQQKQQPNNASKATEKPFRPLVKGGFLKQKGRLSVPVKGRVKYRYGARLPESGMLAEGMFFDTQKEKTVHSIFRGRVLFADFLKGYGLLLIIDHGDSHISLYGHNQLLYKKVGDMVETNELVAESGTTGGLRTAGLYFEIRNNATPVDPAVWCQI